MRKKLTSSIQEPSLSLWSLQNDTLCVSAEMSNATLTCIDLWIKAGSLYEENGEEGIAHFLEHMVFKGGSHLKEGDFDRKIEALGGSSNAATGFDDVHFHVLVPAESVEPAINLLVNLVLEPTFDSNAFEIERQVVLEEIAQHKDQPDEQIFQELLEICWEGHPYSRPILGFKKSLLEISPFNMKSFHKRLYTGGNCTISIAGIIPDNIQTIINKSILSNLNKTPIEEKLSPRKKINLCFKKEYREISLPRIESSRLIMAWPIPPAKKQSFLIGADIATSLLAEGRRSRLVKHLREDLQIVESIEMDITILEEGGLVLLEALCQEKNLKQVEEEIHLVLKNSLNDPIEVQEIMRAHQLVKNSFYFNLEASTNVASAIGGQTLWGRHQSLLEPLKHIDTWSIEKLKQEILVTLQPEKSSTLIVRPKK